MDQRLHDFIREPVYWKETAATATRTGFLQFLDLCGERRRST